MNAAALRSGLHSAELDALAKFAHHEFGVAPNQWRPKSLERRLCDLMELSASHETPADFVGRLLSAPKGSALHSLALDVLPNQETFFFREVDQLNAFVRFAIPMAATAQRRTGPLRILSVGCATGEEVYSTAMLVFEQLHVAWGLPVEVTGIDISPSAIAAAQRGVFSEGGLRRAGVGPNDWLKRFFRQVDRGWAPRDFLKSMVHFSQGNLLHPTAAASLGQFDAVICRNVLIYFDEQTFRQAVRTLYALARPNGFLLLGRAELGLAAALDLPAVRHDGFLWFMRAEGEWPWPDE